MQLCRLCDFQHIEIRLPDSLPVFELLLLVTDDFPQLCVGVGECNQENVPNSQQLKFDIIELNSAPLSAPGRVGCCASPLPDRQPCSTASTKSYFTPSAGGGAHKAAQVTQLDRDTVLVVLESKSLHIHVHISPPDHHTEI